MKEGVENTVKFKKLKRRLGFPEWQVIGILESVWKLTRVSAPAGDIGRFSNEDIAASIEYDGDADELVRHLIECGWIDEDEVYRLIVHDWSQHVPTYLKGNFAKHNKDFADVSAKQRAKQSAKQGANSTVLPSLTKPSTTQPSQAKPNPAQTNAASQPRDYPKAFEEFWTEYPPNDRTGRKRGKQKSFGLWKKIPESDRASLIEATRNYRREQTEFIRDPERFLKADWWRDHCGDGERITRPTQSELQTPGQRRVAATAQAIEDFANGS